MKNIELRGQRAELIKGAMSLVDNAQKEGRSLNAEEQQKFDAMESDARSMMKQIETLEPVNWYYSISTFRIFHRDHPLTFQRKNCTPGFEH